MVGLHTSDFVCVAEFAEEVTETLERAVEENIGLDNMILEINSLK